MRHALRIFRKDARHLWPQIVVVLAAELALGCAYLWPPCGMAGARVLMDLFEVMAWWYLIAAVIHEEAVPGDRQYWLTRPISRRDLLAAKAVFILVFLCLPSLCGDALSLVVLGKPPVAYLPEMLISQAFFLARVVVPAAALAAITASLVEFVWIPLAALVGSVVVSLLAFRAHTGLHWGGLEWFRTTAQLAVIFAAATALLLVQYAQRRTWLSRGIMVAALLTGELLMWAPGWHEAFALQTILSRQPEAGTAARIAFDPARDPRTRPGFNGMWPGQKDVGFSLPVRVTGVPPGMALFSDRAAVAVEAPNGRRWSSSWDSLNCLFHPVAGRAEQDVRYLLPGDGEYWLYVSIDPSFRSGANRGPTHLHVKLALTLFSPERITTLAPRRGGQAVSDDGFCWVASRGRMFERSCLWPGRRPDYVSARYETGQMAGVPLWGDSVFSYAPYAISAGLWQWPGQTGGMDPTAVVDVFTREAVAHFEREVDVPALEAWLTR